MTEDSALLRWAHVRRELSETRKGVLEKWGLNEDSLETLHEQANAEMTEAEVQLEPGTVYRSEDPIFVHTNSKQIGTTSHLHLRRK